MRFEGPVPEFFDWDNLSDFICLICLKHKNPCVTICRMKSLRHRKLVLFLRTPCFVTNRRMYEGIYEFGRSKKWKVQTVDAPNMKAVRSNQDEKKISEWLKNVVAFWKPDGCIVMGDAVAPLLDDRNFAGIPTVYCDALPESVAPESNLISVDSEAIAVCAARELLELGLDSFAYVSYPEKYAWCDERKNCFRSAIEMNGKMFDSARLTAWHSDVSRSKEFDRWLIELPKPVGILAANDKVAEELIAVCNRIGLSVPNEVAVIGVDNDEFRCENALVSITSIVPEFKKAGWIGAELLDELMDSPCRARCRKFGVGGVVRRASTRKMEKFDKRISDVLEYIRRRSCEGIGVHDVVLEMGCSRRNADLRFSNAVGWSILHEIRRVKTEMVKYLLRETQTQLAAIADMCGFRSCDDMRRTFRQFEGCSLSEWRTSARKGDVA